MMRYQRLSPECLPLPNGRKSTTLKTTCKENTNHSHHHNHHHLHYFAPYPPSTSEPTTTFKSKTFEPNSVTPAAFTTTARVDSTLPQWGHKKRPRGSRSDKRLSGDDASARRKPRQQQHPAKIQWRSVGGSDKLSTATMPPPPPPCAPTYGRGSNPRACTVVSRDAVGVLRTRNVEERPTNGSVSRPEKRCTTTAEKTQKPSSTASYSQNSSAQMDSLNQSSAPSSEEEAATANNGWTTAPSGKVNLVLLEWPRIYLSLSRKEKEDDFLAMRGTKLPQRPKKRAKNIDKTLKYCFPGMWLSDLTKGRYEIREKKCVKKKKRGLKGMESMESDSD